MKNILLTFLVFCCFLPLIAEEKEIRLSQISIRAYFSDCVTESDLNYAEKEGLSQKLSQLIHSNHGFLEPENASEFAIWLMTSLSESGMEETDVYRLALAWGAYAQRQIFNYEKCDSIIDNLNKNIISYIPEGDNRTAWQLLTQSIKPVYSFRRADWNTINYSNQIYYFLKRQPDISQLPRLALLTLQEGAFIGCKLFMTPEELSLRQTEIDNIMTEALPDMPDLMNYQKAMHLLSKISLDYETTGSERNELRRILSEQVVSPYNSASILCNIGYGLISIQKEEEGLKYLSEMQKLMGNIIERQNTVTTVNSDYISYRMFMFEYDNFGHTPSEPDSMTDNNLLISLMDKTGSTESKRCNAAAIAPFIGGRRGQTKTLSTINLARMFLDFVISDPYVPFRIESICDGAGWLYNGGAAEEALDLLDRTVPQAEGFPYQAMVINRTFSSLYRLMGDSSCVSHEMQAIENLKKMNEPDHFELHDIYSFLLNYHTRQGQIDQARQYADLVDRERQYILDDKWRVDADWKVEYIRIITDNDSKSRQKSRLLELYTRAQDMGLYRPLFDIGYELALLEMDNGNKKESREYLDMCFEIYRMDPEYYGGFSFANEYLNHLYNFQSDRTSWNNAFSTIIGEAERTHSDLNFSFVQLLCDQMDNNIHSENLLDCNFCLSLLLAKANTIASTLTPENEYAGLGLMSMIIRPITSFILFANNYIINAKATLTENQQRQLRQSLAQFNPDSAAVQVKEWIKILIDNREKFNATPLDVLSLGNLYVHLDVTPDKIELAQSEIQELKEWAGKNGLGEEYKHETLGTRMDIASITNDSEGWASLIDNDDFWNIVEKGIGNIEMLSSNMSGLIYHNIDKGNFQRAKEIALKRYKLVRDFIDRQYVQLPNSHRSALSDNNIASAYDIHCILPHYTDPELLKTAFNASLYYKNLLLDSDNSLQRAVYRSNDSIQIAEYEKMIALRKSIDFSKMDANQASSLRKLTEYRTLEDSVRNRAFRTGTLKLDRNTALDDISRALRPDEAAIEFIATKDNFGALILRKGDKCPRFTELIPYSDMSYCLDPLSSEGANISPKVRRIYSGKSTRGKKLYDLLWKPIEKHLDGIKRIYYSPVGSLSTLAIGAIQDSAQTAVCQRYDIRLTSTTASIVANRNHLDNPTWNAMAIGDIEYERADETEVHQSRDWKHLNNSIAEVQHFDSICRNNGHIPVLLTGSNATEEVFRKYSGQFPSLILMSTHGFYFNTETAARHNFYINKGLTQLNDSVSPNFGIPSMKRGGLILANANPTWNNDRITIDDEDGILTADEVAELDLSGTDLLVLSACQTGLGDVSLNEGVFGLQRGFKLAGVNTMILSLWEVNDVAASEFMGNFYGSLFNGVERHSAFRDATLKMREKYPADPFRWAMFVMLD